MVEQTGLLLSGVLRYSDLPITFHEKLTHFFNQIFEFAVSEIDREYMGFSTIIEDVENIREGATELMADIKKTLHSAVRISIYRKRNIEPFSSHVVEIKEILSSTGADCLRILQSVTNKIVDSMAAAVEDRVVNHRPSFPLSIYRFI